MDLAAGYSIFSLKVESTSSKDRRAGSPCSRSPYKYMHNILLLNNCTNWLILISLLITVNLCCMSSLLYLSISILPTMVRLEGISSSISNMLIYLNLFLKYLFTTSSACMIVMGSKLCVNIYLNLIIRSIVKSPTNLLSIEYPGIFILPSPCLSSIVLISNKNGL